METSYPSMLLHDYNIRVCDSDSSTSNPINCLICGRSYFQLYHDYCGMCKDRYGEEISSNICKFVESIEKITTSIGSFKTCILPENRTVLVEFGEKYHQHVKCRLRFELFSNAQGVKDWASTMIKKIIIEYVCKFIISEINLEL